VGGLSGCQRYCSVCEGERFPSMEKDVLSNEIVEDRPLLRNGL
jgi:hypothetical protein